LLAYKPCGYYNDKQLITINNYKKGGIPLKVHIDEATAGSIKAFLEENKPEIETLRIHIAGVG